MSRVRYGVVGAGWISQEAFMPAVPQTGNSVLSAIVTGNADVAGKLAEFYGIEHVYDYDGYDEMLASDVVDAVYIALPNSLHADYAIRAAKAGKHALVEKPLAISVAECEAMIAAAEASGTLLMTAYRLHHEPGTVEVLEQIRKGAIGDPRLFTSTFSFQSPDSNHRLKGEHWGGPLQDIGVYCLNAARHVFGAEPVEATATKGHGDGDGRFREVEGSIAVTLRFPGERFAQFIVSFEAGDSDMYRVIGTTGDMVVEPAYRFQDTPGIRLRRGTETSVIEVPSIDHFGAQTAYFSDCILSGEQPESDGAEGLADVVILLAIEKAAKTGRPQAIDLPQRTRHPVPDMVRMIPRTDRRLVF
jgi:predicted dehydrogenase